MRLFSIILTLVVLGCSSSKEPPTNNEIKELALSTGEFVSSKAQKALSGQLMKAMSEGGPTHAVQFCNTAAFPILDTLNVDFQVKIRRTSLRERNPVDRPTKKENKILMDFEERSQNGEELSSTVSMIGEDEILFAKPIMLNNPICLNCHGNICTDIQEETYNLISELYPEDRAIDYEIGDIRGMWSITFQKEELVSYLGQHNGNQE